MTGVLYISYDGILEPLGQSQVLAYLERLAPDFPIHLVSFEKTADWADADRRHALERRIAAAGIEWHPLRYHKRPTAPATALDVAQGTLLAVRLARRHGLSIVHARSYVPSLMALAVKRLTGARYLFDMRGLWADERVDGGLWPAGGRLFKLAKGFERRFLLSADAVVSLTRAGAREITTFPYLASRVPPIAVIPTCADLERFSPRIAPAPRPFILGYVGSVRTWYLFDEALVVFKAVKRHAADAKLLIVNRSDHAFIEERLRAAAIDAADVELVASDHSGVPRHIKRMSAGVALIKPAYSKLASAPTKLAEFLGCGVPCLVNVGVGDLEALISENGAGVVMTGFGTDDYDTAARSLLETASQPDVAERCVEAARKNFSLDEGVRAYAKLYRSLDSAAGPRAAFAALG